MFFIQNYVFVCTETPFVFFSKVVIKNVPQTGLCYLNAV